MIDFRYHLVSLISVFLALAVGIVLGAGPLQNSIGSTLTEQVNSLRADRDDLREQLATSTAAVTHRDEFTEATLPALVSGALTDEAVVVVTLPGVEDDVLDPLTDAIATAGGTVTGRITISDDWTSTEKETERTDTLSALTEELPAGYVPSDGTTAERLAQVLATSVVSASGEPLSEADSQDAATALSGLTTAGLIDVDGDLSGLASGALLVVPANPEATGDTPATTEDVTDAAVTDYLNLATALDETGAGTVATGPASAATGGLLTSVRDDDTVSSEVSTVDTGSTVMGVVTAVLAMKEQLSGGDGSYGFGEGVDAVLPAITVASATSGKGAGK